jgi:acyl-coenzyme A synthetase/AMP-(fatty) acid ligase
MSDVAIHKAGAVALPLSELVGADALRHRLADSGAPVLIAAAGARGECCGIAPAIGSNAKRLGETVG